MVDLKTITNKRWAGLLLIFLLISPLVFAQQYKQIEVNIKDENRTAYVYFPNESSGESKPVLFVFHGHGETGLGIANKLKCEQYWPEAFVVYPQGLKTPGQLVDAKGKLSGWQSSIGDQDDRDIYLIDSIIEYLSGHNINKSRIYLLGHSNGGLFVFTLSAARKHTFAAISSISAIVPAEVRNTLIPIPVFMVTGLNDRLVKPSWQDETLEYLKILNKCEGEGIIENQWITVFKSKIGYDLKSYLWEGGHEIPIASIPYIIEFFKKNKLK